MAPESNKQTKLLGILKDINNVMGLMALGAHLRGLHNQVIIDVCVWGISQEHLALLHCKRVLQPWDMNIPVM